MMLMTEAKVLLLAVVVVAVCVLPAAPAYCPKGTSTIPGFFFERSEALISR